MKFAIFLLIFLYTLAFSFIIIGYRGSAFLNKISPLLLTIALLLGALAGVGLTLPSGTTKEEGKFKAVVDNEVQYYSKCKKENGHCVCETNSGKEIVVDDFWKK